MDQSNNQSNQDITNNNSLNNNIKKNLDAKEKEGKILDSNDSQLDKQNINSESEDSDSGSGMSGVNSDGKSDAIANNTPSGDMGGGDMEVEKAVLPDFGVKENKDENVLQTPSDKDKTSNPEPIVSTTLEEPTLSDEDKSSKDKPKEDKASKDGKQDETQTSDLQNENAKDGDGVNKDGANKDDKNSEEKNKLVEKTQDEKAQEYVDAMMKKNLEKDSKEKVATDGAVTQNNTTKPEDPQRTAAPKTQKDQDIQDKTVTSDVQTGEVNANAEKNKTAKPEDSKTVTKNPEDKTNNQDNNPQSNQQKTSTPPQASEENKQSEEQKLKKSPEEIANETGMNEGLMLGRSMALGYIIEKVETPTTQQQEQQNPSENVETSSENKDNDQVNKTEDSALGTPNEETTSQKTEKTTPKVVYKQTSFAEHEGIGNSEGETVEKRKENYVKKLFEEAKTKYDGEENGKVRSNNYREGFMRGYNLGYLEGEQYKKDEAKAKQQKEIQERQNKPEYLLGLQIGKYAAMLGIKGGEAEKNDKGETKFVMEATNGVTYDTTLKAANENGHKGLDPLGKNPAGESVSDTTNPDNITRAEEAIKNYKAAFIIGYNGAYQEVMAKKNKQPTHQEKLAEPNFRKGYEIGNKLGRNKTLTPQEKAQNPDNQKYMSKEAQKAAETNQAFRQERSGFIYGYNSAYYQLQAEAKAKAKALKERKEKDPAYILGKTAGTIKGILASLFGEMGISEALDNPAKIKEQGLSFVIPEEVAAIIKQNALPSNSPVLVKPENEQDPKKKADLEAQKEEQLLFFYEGYQRTFVEGYQKGQKDKQIYEQNKYRNDPDYQAALKPILEVKEGSADSEEGEITLKLNAGALKAYSEHKLKHMTADDPDRKHWEAILASTIKLRESGTQTETDKDGKKIEVKKTRSDAYKRGYDECYGYFISKLRDPEDPVNAAINNKIAQEQYGGKSESEKDFYAIGTALANEKVKEQDAIQAKKDKGELDATSAINERKIVEDKFAKVQIAIQCDLANRAAASKSPALQWSFSTDSYEKLKENVNTLETEAVNAKKAEEDKKDKANPDIIAVEKSKIEAVAAIKKAWNFFINGYNAVFYKKINAKVGSDNVNDAEKMKKAMEMLENKYGKTPPTDRFIEDPNVKGFEIKESDVALALAQKAGDAKKIFQQAAAEGYNTAYGKIKNIKDKGIGDIEKKITTIYLKTEYESKVKEKERSLLSEQNGDDAQQTKKTTSARNPIVKGLLFFFIKGFNFAETISSDADFGVAKALLHGKSFLAGYRGEARPDKGSKDAYNAGQNAKMSGQSYSDFKTGMDNLKSEEEKKYAATPVEEQRSDSEDPYNLGKNKDLNIWKLIVKCQKKQKLDDVEAKMLDGYSLNLADSQEEGSSLYTIKVKDNISKIINNPSDYITLAVNYYAVGVFKKYQDIVKAENTTLLAEEIREKAYEKRKPEVEEFEKGYNDKLKNLEVDIQKNINDGLFYAHGYKDGFLRVRPGTLPKALQIVEEKKEEGEQKQGTDIIIDKNHPQYKLGNIEGAELAQKIKLGFISEEKIDEEVASEYQKKKPKIKVKDENGNEKLIENTAGDSDYVSGQKDGKKVGENAAKMTDFNNQLPNPEEFNKLKENPETEADNKKGGSGMDGGEEESSSNVTDSGMGGGVMDNNVEENSDPIIKSDDNTSGGGMGDIPNIHKEQGKKELTALYKEGFNNSYWKGKDAKSGEIEGLKAGVNDESKPISEYYEVIEDDASSKNVKPEKRAIKDKNIFENSFINAKEAAWASDKPNELLKTVLQIDENKDYTQGKADGKKAARELLIVSSQENSQDKQENNKDLSLVVPKLEEYFKISNRKGSSGSMGGDEASDTPIPEYYKKGFYETFWKIRDAKLGEKSGIDSVINGHSEKPIDEYFEIVGETEFEKKIEGKTAIRNKDIFEAKFKKGRESAQRTKEKGGSLKDLADSIFKAPTGEQIKAKEYEKFIKTAKLKAKRFGYKMAERYAYYKASKSTSTDGKTTVTGKLDEIFALKQKLTDRQDKLSSLEKQKSEIEHPKTAEDAKTKTPELSWKDKKEAISALDKKANALRSEIQFLEETLSPHKALIEKLERDKKVKKVVEEGKPPVEETTKELQTYEEAKKELESYATDRELLGLKLAEWFENSESDSASEDEEKEVTNEEDEGDEDTQKDTSGMGGGSSTESVPTLGNDQTKKEVPLTFLTLKDEDKKILYEVYDKEYNTKKDFLYFKAISELAQGNLFDNSLGNAIKMLGNEPSVSLDTQDNQNQNQNQNQDENQEEKSDSDIINDILNAFDEATDNDGVDVVLNDMFIVGDFYNLESLMRNVHDAIPQKQQKITNTEYEIFGWEQKLLKEKNNLNGKKELEDKIAELVVKQQDNTITPEETNELKRLQNELKKFAPATTKVQNIEETIKKLEVSADNSRKAVDTEVDKIRLMLENDLKLSFSDKKATNETILDYVNYFNKQLKLGASFNYKRPPVNLLGNGFLTIYENAEDVYIDADIKIRKGKYKFMAKGFEYIEDKEYINLFKGSAVIPRLEGDASANVEDRREYFFDEIGLKLSEGVRGQLKYQQNKLTGGEIPKSTGDRKKGGTSGEMDSKAPQNIPK